MRYIIIGIGLVIALGAIYFVVSDRNPGTGQGSSLPERSSQSGDFDAFAAASLVDYSGTAVSLEEFRGRPLVINSWAVWCPSCREELPDFARLQQEFGDAITVIAIDRQEPLAKARGYTDLLGITNGMLFLLDSSDSFYRSIGGFSMPETIFVNASGDIVVHKRGPMELDEMREHANTIISTNESSL